MSKCGSCSSRDRKKFLKILSFRLRYGYRSVVIVFLKGNCDENKM